MSVANCQHQLPITVSIGVASALAGDESLDALLRRADGALYAAKNGGRNRVVAHDTDAENRPQKREAVG